MLKPYDVSELVTILKSKGLDIAEEAASLVVESSLQWIKESAKLSATPYDDMALIVLPQVESFIKNAVDKIDGQVG
jgi:hypothetical protein